MIEGEFLWTANDLMPPEAMLVEAMAQFAGGLAFAGRGMLTGVDRCELRRAVNPGDRVTIQVTLEAEFGGTYRFAATAAADGVEIGRGRFYLASPDAKA